MPRAWSPLFRRIAWTSCAARLATAWSDGGQERAPGEPVTEAGDGRPGFTAKAGSTQWSIGDPTDEEQLFLEYMNRARLDPVGEGDRVFVDYNSARVKRMVDFFLQQRPGVEFTRAENRDAFHRFVAKPPLVFDSRLIDAARAHASLMRENDEQSHQLDGELGLLARINAAGYLADFVGENVFAFADEMLHAHAGFAVDPGQAIPSGQPRPRLGHRITLMDVDGRGYRTVGVGVLADTDPKTHVGPRLVTVDFAAPASSEQKVFVTGVVYEDKDDDGFYSLGEGLKDVRIDVDAGSDHFAITTASGGYAIPMAGGIGVVHVTATAAPGTPAERVVGTQTVTVNVQNASLKVDFSSPPDPPLPDFVSVTNSGQPTIDDSAPTTSDIALTSLAGVSDLTGDVQVGVTIRHPAREELKVSLVGPTGEEVVLFDHGPPGVDLVGTFDASLASIEPLAGFEGLSRVGTWRLSIVDGTPGNSGSLESWTLRVRPQWARSLHAPATSLFVTKLTTKNKSSPAGDSLQLAAVVNTGSTSLGTVGPSRLRLLAADAAHAELFSAALAPNAVKRALKGTSKCTVSAKLAKLDLPTLPGTVVVELALDGSIVRETVPLTNGSFNGATTKPAQQALHIDTLVKKTVAGTPNYVFTGRLATTGTLLGTDGPIELFLGEVHEKTSLAQLVAKGKTLSMKGSKAIKLLTIDPTKGTFSLTVATKLDVRPGQTLDLALRLGTDGFYGDVSIVPAETATSLKY